MTYLILVHIALEIPVAIQGVWTPSNLPFLQLNNTAAVIILKEGKLYENYLLGSLDDIAICLAPVSVLPHRSAILRTVYVSKSLPFTYLSNIYPLQ